MRFYAARPGVIPASATAIEPAADGAVDILAGGTRLTRLSASHHACAVGRGPALKKTATFLGTIPEVWEEMTKTEGETPRYFASETNFPVMPPHHPAEVNELLHTLLQRGRPVVVAEEPPRATAAPQPAVRRADRRPPAPAPAAAPEPRPDSAAFAAARAARVSQDRRAADYTAAIEKVKTCRNPVLKKRFKASAEKIYAELTELMGQDAPPPPAELLSL